MRVLPFNFKHTSSAALGALSLAAVLAFAGPVGAAEADPAGNNGTIKIDGVTLDDAPNNEPHPGCSFEVDFYGFDADPGYKATVTFAVHNPTRDDDVLKVGPAEVIIGGTPNDGGGSEAGLDASQSYDLSQALADGDYEPGPQGYHIKLTVHADGSIGADTKHKVFWVTDCETVPPVDDDDEIIDNEIVVIEEDDDDIVVVNEPVVDSTEVTVSGAVAAPSAANDVVVLGETLVRPDVAAAPGELPRTGSAIYPSLALGGMLLMLGALARRLGRVQTVRQP